MSGVRKIEHAKLRVPDVERSVSFYTDVMGLVELDRTDNAVYLGCGYDDHFDLAVVPGDGGVDHVAVRVDDPTQFGTMADRLADADVSVGRTDGVDPGEVETLRFPLPSGVEIELVRMDDAAYLHPAYPRGGANPGSGPLDLDHANLASTRVEADATFLRDALGFDLSDVRHSGETWVQAFTRLGDHHHDVALTSDDDPDNTLHHLAWHVSSIEGIKDLADRLAATEPSLEMGAIGRHQAGGCIFAYFLEPGGNRFELCTEMPTLDGDTDVTFRDADAEDSSISAWGELAVPESFASGS